MSKFCGVCGTQAEDSANVCGNCGNAFNDQAENTKTAPIPGADAVKDKIKSLKTDGLMKKGIIAIAAVVVGIIIISSISSSAGYKGTVKKVINAFEKNDVEKLCSYASGLNYYDEDEIDEYEENFEDRISDRLDDYEDEVGDNIKIKYEITKVKDIEDRKKEKFLEEFEDFDGYPKKIGDIKEIQMKLTVKGSDDEETYKVKDFYVIKENGKWKVLYYRDIWL